MIFQTVSEILCTFIIRSAIISLNITSVIDIDEIAERGIQCPIELGSKRLGMETFSFNRI